MAIFTILSIQFPRLVGIQSLAFLYLDTKNKIMYSSEDLENYGSSTNWRANLKTYPYNRSVFSRVFLIRHFTNGSQIERKQ